MSFFFEEYGDANVGAVVTMLSLIGKQTLDEKSVTGGGKSRNRVL